MGIKFPLKKGSKKIINAWASYDWANSVFFLVITSTIFPIYYSSLFVDQNTIPFFGYEIKNTALISYITALAFTVIVFISPILSGIADFIGNKKGFMKFFVYFGSLSCIGLYWFEIKTLQIGLVCYFFALIGAWGSLVYYNSYLPDIAFPEQHDRTSAKGFAFGYVGSVILLIFNLAMVMKPDFFGIEGNDNQATVKAMKYSFVTVGLWWSFFSQYSFYYLPKGNDNSEKFRKDIIWNGYLELKKVWNQLSQNLNLRRYLRAFFVYSIALQTVMLVAAYFGESEILWPSEKTKTFGLIISILLIQIVAIFGAITTTLASERYGNIITLIVINLIWALVCVYAFFIKTPFQFYIAAGLVGIVMGGMQALSRSTYSKLIPKTQNTTSFFSFYDVTEKIAIVIGMTTFGIIDQVSGGMRNSVFMFLTLFIVAAFMLRRVFILKK
ncbi:MAG: MFS transporter [Bacteroidota bacterium]|nr:MFS transporter [Bacteroidota bacterium]